jgi:hypothetical protein
MARHRRIAFQEPAEKKTMPRVAKKLLKQNLKRCLPFEGSIARSG